MRSRYEVDQARRQYAAVDPEHRLVTVTVEGDTERVDVELRWAGGFVSHHTITRPVQTYEQLSNYNELVQRIGTLRAAGKSLSETAAVLNAEGFHPPKRSLKFTKEIVNSFLRERRARAGTLQHDPLQEQHLEADEWPHGL